jgi:hypothetical protein
MKIPNIIQQCVTPQSCNCLAQFLSLKKKFIAVASQIELIGFNTSIDPTQLKKTI